MSKKNTLDQYYTKPEIAEWCWERITERFGCEVECIEPSAGEGAFLKKGMNIKAFDLEPKHPEILQMDFFNLKDSELLSKVIVGNPPFGWASSLALKFINKASVSKAVCFILPRTFMKEVFQQKIRENLHLTGEWELPKNSFLLHGEEYDVPCCFQIWENLEYSRTPIKINQYLREDQKGTYFLRRVGGRAGQFVSEKEFTDSTTYKVSCSDDVKCKVEQLYPEIKKVASQTAGVRSITITEINHILTKEST